MNDGISVIVRAHNDGQFVARTLAVLAGQRIGLPVEILCCDDASADDTAKLIASCSGVREIRRPEGAYIPGRTLNHLVRQCRFRIVVFNNADAVPRGERFLDVLTAPLRQDEADAVYANQLPRPEACWLVRRDHERAFGGSRSAGKPFFSLASAAVFRKDILADPFNESLRYSEDVEWAFRKKRRIVYVPEARTEHSHNYTFRELWKRFYGEGYAEGEIFGHGPGLAESLFGAGADVLRDFVYLLPHLSGWREIGISPVRRTIQRLARWKGAADYFGKEK